VESQTMTATPTPEVRETYAARRGLIAEKH